MLNRMNGSFATKIIQQIVESPELFNPVQSRVYHLRDVVPQHTEIIFIQPENGRKLRLEADIDCALEGEQNLFESGTGTGQFQIGTTKLFYADTRNKRADITTVDITRYGRPTNIDLFI
jgi:hypothetical protein